MIHRWGMSRFVSLLGMLILSSTVVTEAAGDETPLAPYIAYVAREGEYTRCGPSEDFYQADPLLAGQAVEVYVETKAGWLGIRPPQNSFCWLQADQVRVADDETTGTIIDDAAVAWIGTHLGRAKQYRWQVQFQMGEEVTIIGTARRQGADGDDVWFRVVPPPGEFRWVHEDQIVDSPDLVERPENPGKNAPAIAGEGKSAPQRDSKDKLSQGPVGSGLAATTAATAKSGAGEGGDSAGGEEVSTVEGSGRRPAPPESGDTPSLGTSLRDWLLAGNLRESAESTPAATTAAPSQQGDVGPAVLPVQFQSGNDGGFQPSGKLDEADVEGLKLELSRAMAVGARASDVEPLRKRSAWLAQNASSSVDRGRAALMLQRIEEYQQIARRRDGQPLDAVPAGAAEAEHIGRIAESGLEAKFDRQGQLVRVYSSRPNTPPFAIHDSAGRTVCYVTPVPGINLQRYLNHEVGLYGRMALDSSQETPHLIAEQAVRLRR